MIKICHISTVHNVFDDRIFHKECVSLAKAGFDVTLIVKHSQDEIIDGVKICALPNKSSRSYRLLLQFIALSKAIKINAKAYHFHDPELIFIGLFLRLIGKKVIYDVHEDYPSQILTKEWIKYKIIRSASSKLIALLESICGAVLNKTIVVSNSIGSRFPSKSVVLIRNMPILAFIDKEKPKSIQKTSNIVIYTGGLTRIRGIFELVEAMNYTLSNTKLWLLGAWEDDNYQKECINSTGWKKTEDIGLIPFGEHYQYIKAADIGIVTFLPVPNHINAMPNKPFEYISCEKPIVMSNFPLWKSLFEGVAIFCDPSNPKEIALKIDELVSDDVLRINMGRKGRENVEANYSWEAESIRLIEMYNQLLRKKG